jgi:linoleoyl-CoA desaturase
MNTSSLRFVELNKDKAAFFAILRRRVDAYFAENKISKHGNRRMMIKTILLLSGYLLPFITLLINTPPLPVALCLWAVMGFCMAGTGMCIMHDANHNAYSGKRKVNLLLGHTLNLVGGSVFNWKLQHNQLHHTYTNIVTHDDDVQDKAILRFSPHGSVRWYHRLQYLYAIPFYSILTLYWALFKDFVQFIKYTREGVNKNNKRQNTILLLKIVADKAVYFFTFFVLPVYFLNIPFTEVLCGFLLMHAISGVILTVVFQLAHAVEGTTHPIACSEGSIENSWAIHQLSTTANFATDSKFLTWYLGGLNFQVEHHLFPAICHVHYPMLAPIVRATAEEFNIGYLENETFSTALASHFRMLKRFGNLPSMNEAIV